MQYPTGKLIDEYSFPHLWKSLQNISQKSNVEFDKGVYVTDTKRLGLFRWLFLNSSRDNTLYLGDKALETLNFKNSFDKVSPELEAILYHELAHSKYNDGTKLILARSSPIIGLAAGLLAVNLIERYQRRKGKGVKPAPHSDKNHNQKNDSEEAIVKVKTPKTAKQQVIQVAKYIAGAALGFGVGLAVNSAVSRHIEYRADRFAAEMMGSPEPLINALNQYVHKMREFERGITGVDAKTHERYVNVMESLFHAPLNKRIERLEAMQAQQR